MSLLGFVVLAAVTVGDEGLAGPALVVGAGTAMLVPDLRERCMLGDTGANVLGAAVGLGVVAIVASILAGPKFNVSILVGLAFAVAASSNLPALLMALFWPRFNTTGAVAGVLGGLTVSLVLIILSPPVWPGPASHGSPVALSNPAIISIPAGFLCCWLGTMLGRERATQRSYLELHVRAETGLGAE